jgi:hypothetical protein
MRLDDWEYAAPAQLQYRPAHVNPTGPEAWGQPKPFATLRDAVRAAITDPTPPAQVAYITTSGGHTLEPRDIEDLWLGMQAG